MRPVKRKGGDWFQPPPGVRVVGRLLGRIDVVGLGGGGAVDVDFDAAVFERAVDQVVLHLRVVEAVADGAELTKADAGRAVDAMIAAVTKALKKGDTVTLVGFGTFSVRKRGARTGRNPRTGDTIKIKASKNPAFKAGKALKDAVN